MTLGICTEEIKAEGVWCVCEDFTCCVLLAWELIERRAGETCQAEQQNIACRTTTMLQVVQDSPNYTGCVCNDNSTLFTLRVTLVGCHVVGSGSY